MTVRKLKAQEISPFTGRRLRTLACRVVFDAAARARARRYVRPEPMQTPREEHDWPVWEVAYVPTLGEFEHAGGGMIHRQPLGVIVIERLRARTRYDLLTRLAERGEADHYERIDVVSLGRVVWQAHAENQLLFG